MSGFGNQDERARGFVEEGEKALKKSNIMGSLFGNSTQKYEDAAEAFGKAANCYKVGRRWQEAGDMYKRCAEMHHKCQSAHEAVTATLEAAKCYKNVDPVAAVGAYRAVVGHYHDMGRFQQAAKVQKELAEIFEADGNWPDALAAYQQAADLFLGENTVQSANSCLLKVATILSKEVSPPQFGKAADIFEQLGRSCMETRLLQMNAKAYWLQAGLCHMAAGDSVAVRQKLDEFKSVDYTFEASRECKFLEDLVQALEDYNADTFSEVCFEYDKTSKLDPWKTGLLLRVKKQIEGGGGGGGAGGAVGGDGELDLT